MRIYLPDGKEYELAPDIGIALRRYDCDADCMVTVTQDWVDDAQKTMLRQWMEIQGLRREILEAAMPTKAAEPTFDFDRMFKRVDKARAAFGGM